MPFAQKLLLYIPAIPLGIMVVLLAVGLSMLGLLIVWRLIPRQVLKVHNDLTGAMFEAVALAYTVLLAFVVVISWQDFDKATIHVETQANCLVDIYRGSAAFSQPFKDEVRTRIKEYAQVVVDDEWSLLARAEESMKARAVLKKIWALYTEYEPKTEREKAFFADAIRKLDDLREARRLCIIDAGTGIQPILWFILIAGAVVTIGFTFFFGSDKFMPHMIMAATLAAIIALILFTILSFDYPFTGSICISPEIFKQTINF